MIALCVDDENLPLQTLSKAVSKSPDIQQVAAFDDEIDALDWAAANHADIAFLDIELHAMNGMELAKKLLALQPDISIVFCTGYEQYAVQALNLHMDAGYLVKPFRASQVQREIEHAKEKHQALPSASEPFVSPPIARSIEIRIMGEFTISVDGEMRLSLPEKLRKGAAFLEYLILNSGTRIPKQRLTNLFWPEYIYTNPDSALKTLVSRLRKNLGEICTGLDNCIVSESGCYLFQVLPGISVDVLEIRQILDRLKTEISPQNRNTLCRRLILLYENDLWVPDDIPDICVYSVELHNAFLSAVGEYSSWLLKNEQFDQVIDLCHTALLVDPFDEGLTLRVMEAQTAGGKPEEAWKEYISFRNLIAKHMDTVPGEELQAFARDLSRRYSLSS